MTLVLCSIWTIVLEGYFSQSIPQSMHQPYHSPRWWPLFPKERLAAEPHVAPSERELEARDGLEASPSPDAQTALGPMIFATVNMKYTRAILSIDIGFYMGSYSGQQLWGLSGGHIPLGSIPKSK